MFCEDFYLPLYLPLCCMCTQTTVINQIIHGPCRQDQYSRVTMPSFFLFVTVVAGAAYLLSQVILRFPISLIYAAELSAS
jgi:hypothetical protein